MHYIVIKRKKKLHGTNHHTRLTTKIALDSSLIFGKVLEFKSLNSQKRDKFRTLISHLTNKSENYSLRYQRSTDKFTYAACPSPTNKMFTIGKNHVGKALSFSSERFCCNKFSSANTYTVCPVKNSPKIWNASQHPMMILTHLFWVTNINRHTVDTYCVEKCSENEVCQSRAWHTVRQYRKPFQTCLSTMKKHLPFITDL
jgi:hypothetical protein